jgi:hypothetical protein
MNDTRPQNHQEKWVLVDFESAEIHPGEKPASTMLTVTGNTPACSVAGCPVKLAARTYFAQPEFWGIEVMWDRADAIFQTLCPFKVSIPLEGIRGTKGIEVVGRTRSEQIFF